MRANYRSSLSADYFTASRRAADLAEAPFFGNVAQR